MVGQLVAAGGRQRAEQDLNDENDENRRPDPTAEPIRLARNGEKMAQKKKRGGKNNECDNQIEPGLRTWPARPNRK
jgi:hypothetical protein